MTDRPSPAWFKNAIIYAVDVRTFMDGNGDGVGDFPGLTSRLDYLADLGINCLWLLPFYPTPYRDNGYDVKDYYDVDSRVGSLHDFVDFVHRAGEHGIRVLPDFVMNHTSDEHPWFKAARLSKPSRYHAYYVWSEEAPPVPLGQSSVFPGEVDSVWTWDSVARAYYYHKFYDFQPDLNVVNPEVQEEIRNVLELWLAFGISGFRIDSTPFMINNKGVPGATPRDPDAVLKEFLGTIGNVRPGAAVLAEMGLELAKLEDYFQRPVRPNLPMNFLTGCYLFLALARREAAPLAMYLRHIPPAPVDGQWANILRNLDELNLHWLSDAEREDVFRAFAPEPGMRIFGRGIRRRLAPMLGGDRRRIELAFSLLFAMIGTPLLAYGDEIGIGDDLSLPGRDAVHVAMQWSEAPNAGFSSAPGDALIRPVVTKGQFSYERVNVAAQQKDPGSLLNSVKKLIVARRSCPEIGAEKCQVVETGEPGVLAQMYRASDGAVVAVHNLAPEPCDLALDVGLPGGNLSRLVGSGEERFSKGKLEIHLPAYGYRWYRAGNQ